MCVKGSLVIVLVLDWTQCLPQGVGAPPAMLGGRTAGFPKKLDGRASGEAGIDGYNLHQPRAGCIRLVQKRHITYTIIDILTTINQYNI